MMDLTETQSPGGLSAELRAADGWVPAGCSACGKGLGPRPPSSRPRGLQGVRGTSHMAISASPSHTWEQCSARRPRDSGRRACPPFWATLEHATSVKAPGLLRAQARAAACSGAPDLEGFPERQPHPRFSPPPDLWVPGLHGGDPGHRQRHLGARGRGALPGLPALGRGGGQCLFLRLPLLLVLHHHPQHRRAHIPLRQVRAFSAQLPAEPRRPPGKRPSPAKAEPPRSSSTAPPPPRAVTCELGLQS